jgi:membrane protease YdiL (CAAX protease family)
MSDDVPNNSAQEGRLQRKASVKGSFISTFRQVFLRHGLTMGFIAVCCLILPEVSQAIAWSSSPLMSAPIYYFGVSVGLLLSFFIFLRLKGHQLTQTQVAWLGYLLFISVVEEFAFRLMLPSLLVGVMGIIPAAVLSNVLFASIHYITLRWKLINCLGVFFGGMGLSRLLSNTEDIALVILVHWFFTFLNTPTSPSRQAQAVVSE